VLVNTKSLAWGGLGIIVRAVIVWYLSQAEVAGQFPPKSS